MGLNDLYHVQRIERRRERAALVFGIGIDERCIVADNYAWTTQILAQPVQQFRREVVMQHNRICWGEKRFVRVIDEVVIVHLRAGGPPSRANHRH